MPIKNKNSEIQSKKTAKEKTFEYQLQTLTSEIEHINQAIARLDEMTQTTKQWAILTWTGSISFILGQQSLKQYIFFTAVIPILFWIIDARWRYWLGHFSYRERKISEFINSNALQKAYEQQSFSGFTILDPLGRAYRNTPEFMKKRTFRKSLMTTEVFLLYAGMFVISIAIGTIFLLTSIP